MRATRGAFAAVLVAAALAAACAGAARASRYLRVGIYDQALTLYGAPSTWTELEQLHVQELRLNLYWGGPDGVAKEQPTDPTDPADPAYDWTLYDDAIQHAAAAGIRVLLTIVDTPSWANGGKPPNVAPTRPADLQAFAVAAATRYSGSYAANGTTLPAVREWTAWNEPNNPVFLSPQYLRTAHGFVMESAVQYAKICNAVYAGIHSLPYASERVACGVTAPRGNNDPSSARPSVSPLAFLRAVKRYGLKTFDAWAHHPYPSSPSETPTTAPRTVDGVPSTAVTLGNIGTLIRTLTQLYGNKRVWITEYGYQTNPPDSIFGVTWAKQARYLTEAFAIARRNPRIDMMLWFLLRDEPALSGWQSGLMTVAGRRKPAFAAFSAIAAG